MCHAQAAGLTCKKALVGNFLTAGQKWKNKFLKFCLKVNPKIGPELSFRNKMSFWDWKRERERERESRRLRQILTKFVAK